MAIIRSLYGEVISWAKTDMIDLLSKRDLPAALLRDRPGTATSGFLHILTGPVGVLEKTFRAPHADVRPCPFRHFWPSLTHCLLKRAAGCF